MNFDEEALSYDVSRETLQKLKDFMQILLEWNQKINLVSKNAEKELETRHLLDSLQLIDYIRKNAKLLVDVGSGSGFPGIVLAIACQEKFPALKIVLIEQERTGKWLAEQLGKSTCTVSKWCKNTVQPDLNTLDSISKLLDVSIKDLIVDNK